MQGFQLTFFTRQDRKHGHTALAEWLLQEARKMGMTGGTMIVASEGFGHDGKFHSAHFLELVDQPVQVTIAASEADTERFFEHLREEKVNVFYVKAPIQFGMTGE
jgi:PII-like signaling protein